MRTKVREEEKILLTGVSSVSPSHLFLGFRVSMNWRKFLIWRVASPWPARQAEHRSELPRASG